MPYGIIRGLVGALSIAASVGTSVEIKMNELMTPNEIADRRFSPEDHQKHADIQQALNQKSGPLYNIVVQDCKRGRITNDLNRVASSVIVSAIESVNGKPLPRFDIAQCIDDRIKSEAYYSGPVVAKGTATEAYKAATQEGLKNSGLLFLAFGLGLGLSSYRAMSKATKKESNNNEGPTTSSVPS